MNDEQEKLDFLDSCFDDDFCTDAHFAVLKSIARDAEPYIRGQAACVTVNFVCEGARELLLQLADDEDALVRAEAYDSLSCFPCDEAEAFLRGEVPEECDPLARSYAILSWAGVAAALCRPSGDCLANVRQWEERDRNPHCRLSLCYARQRFGDENAWREILAFLQHEDYHLRCAALSLLGDIEDTSRQAVIEAAVSEMLRTETTRAVQSAARRYFPHLC